MNRLTVIAAIAALWASSTATAQTTQRLAATKANDYALVYTLPNTTLDITIETEKTVVKPG
jgi:hypothetical protein